MVAEPTALVWPPSLCGAIGAGWEVVLATGVVVVGTTSQHPLAPPAGIACREVVGSTCAGEYREPIVRPVV